MTMTSTPRRAQAKHREHVAQWESTVRRRRMPSLSQSRLVDPTGKPAFAIIMANCLELHMPAECRAKGNT